MTSADAIRSADAIPSGDELLARARDIVPILRAEADANEAAGKLTDKSLNAMIDAGLFRLRTAKEWGGYEVDLRTFINVVSELGRGCSSASWLGFILNGNDWIMGLYPKSAQADVYADGPDVRVVGVFESAAEAKKVDGGIVVSGRWAFASGCHHSQWAMLGFPITDDAGNPVDQGLALVPMGELAIESTWQVTGMAGTGSDTLVGSDIFVAADRIFAFSEAAQGNYADRSPGAIFQAPFVPAAVLQALPPVLGMARGALDLTLERLGKGKRVAYSFYDDARQAAPKQIGLARAAQLIDTAFLHAYRSADAIDRAGETGEEMDFVARAQVRMDCGYAAQCCRDAVDHLLNIQGASAFALANPMQRIWRDLETASRHGLLDTAICEEIYGRALLGVEERSTVLI